MVQAEPWDELETTMTETDRATRLNEQLEALGDARDCAYTRGKEPTYLSELDLEAGDVPLLVDTAAKWARNRDSLGEYEEPDAAFWAPVHAWRALLFFQAPEAVGPLLEILDPLDETEDDWYLEEWPAVFASGGGAGVGQLTGYLRDGAHREFGRVCVANALKMIAQREPELRDEIVGTLAAALEAETEQYGLAGALVNHLLDLKATEAAETIERAYAEDRVDLTACGNWNDVRKELGVAGMGICSPQQAAAESHLVQMGKLFRSKMKELGMSGMGKLEDPKQRRARRKKERQRRKRNRQRRR